MPSPLTLSVDSGFRRTLILSLAICIAIAALLFVFYLLGADPVVLLRDRSAQKEPGLFGGLFSTAGWTVMGLSGLAALLAVLRGSRDSLILAIAVFALVFALDDGLMIHETLGQGMMPVVLLVYTLLVGLLAGLAWRRGGVRALWPLAAVFAAFALSALIDMGFDTGLFSETWDRVSRIEKIAEDAFKLVGVLIFAAFAAGQIGRSE